MSFYRIYAVQGGGQPGNGFPGYGRKRTLDMEGQKKPETSEIAIADEQTIRDKIYVVKGVSHKL